MKLRKSDIQYLLDENSLRYKEIDECFEKSLMNKEIPKKLRSTIKSFLETSKSILDYCAHDIAELLGIKSEKIYFPIVGINKDVNSFKGAIGRNLSHLYSKDEKMFNFLESLQPYYERNEWLAYFSAICITNKHDRLLPLSRLDIKKFIEINGESAFLKITGNASMKLGLGGKFCFDGRIFYGPQEISPNSKFIQYIGRPLDIKIERWIDFVFEGYENISATKLIKQIHKDVPLIISNIYKLLIN